MIKKAYSSLSPDAAPAPARRAPDLDIREVLMPKLYVTNRQRQQTEVRAEAGLSVMEVIRNNGLDEMVALCGGGCSCATCHVYVDPSFQEMLPPMSDDENELLDGSRHRTPASRLSCQLKLDESMDGLKITIAPED